MMDNKTVYIYTDEHGCQNCKRFVCNHSKWSILWHRIIHWHQTGIVLKNMTIEISNNFDDEDITWTITGPAQPGE